MNALKRMIKTIQVESAKKTRGRPKLTWVELIRKDMATSDLRADITMERNGVTGFM